MRRTFWQWLGCKLGRHDVAVDEYDTWLYCRRTDCRWMSI